MHCLSKAEMEKLAVNYRKLYALSFNFPNLCSILMNCYYNVMINY